MPRIIVGFLAALVNLRHLVSTDGSAWQDKEVNMHKAEQLADELGISMRTFYRRLKLGEIEGVDTIAGKRYQVAENARPEPAAAFIRRSPSPLVVENQNLKNQVEALQADVEALTRRLDALVQWSSVTNQRLNRAKIR